MKIDLYRYTVKIKYIKFSCFFLNPDKMYKHFRMFFFIILQLMAYKITKILKNVKNIIKLKNIK